MRGSVSLVFITGKEVKEDYRNHVLVKSRWKNNYLRGFIKIVVCKSSLCVQP
jgi:hypothetical protein